MKNLLAQRWNILPQAGGYCHDVMSFNSLLCPCVPVELKAAVALLAREFVAFCQHNLDGEPATKVGEIGEIFGVGVTADVLQAKAAFHFSASEVSGDELVPALGDALRCFLIAKARKVRKKYPVLP